MVRCHDRYSAEDLREIAQRVRGYHGQVRLSVTFNNNHEDDPVVKALDLKRLLGLDVPGSAGAAP